MKITRSIFLILTMLISCSGKGSNLSPDCNIDAGPCIKSNMKKEISFGIEPRPVRAMESLHFRVKLANYKNTQSVIVDLSMPEMSMGYNQVPLNKTGINTFEGRGIIPFCPSGKGLWKASVIINDKVEERFLINVHY
ncbi:MAG: hypothetical protein AABY42_01360 [Nitrospirota bacterium]